MADPTVYILERYDLPLLPGDAPGLAWRECCTTTDPELARRWESNDSERYRARVKGEARG